MKLLRKEPPVLSGDEITARPVGGDEAKSAAWKRSAEGVASSRNPAGEQWQEEEEATEDEEEVDTGPEVDRWSVRPRRAQSALA
jgi:hypothetical protein